MAETIEGGVYLRADGKTYVDCNDKPVSKEKVNEFLRLKKIEAQEEAQEASAAVAPSAPVIAVKPEPAKAQK